jgi:hypothetical protein
VSFQKLVTYVGDMHPVTDNKTSDGMFEGFGLCTSIGLLPVCLCLNKKPTKLSQELGVGPTLFLMSTRAMAWLFFMLSIINIPAFAYYYKGTSTNSDGEATTNEAT